MTLKKESLDSSRGESVRFTSEVKCFWVREAGGAARKEAYTVHTVNIISDSLTRNSVVM